MGEIDERFGDLEDRLIKAERIWANLNIVGPGWAGDVDEGFTFNPQNPSTKPSLKVDCLKPTIQVTISGVTICSSLPPGYNITGVNGTFILPNVVGFPCLWAVNAGNSGFGPGVLSVFFQGGSFTVHFWQLGNYATFQATAPYLGLTNFFILCGQSADFTDYAGSFGPGALSGGFGGTATIDLS
jgi:hypothetical protein